MSIIEVILVGLIVGAVARLLVPGRNPIGILGTLGIGVGGSFLGWWIGDALVGTRALRAHPWLWAIGGAVLLLLLLRSFTSRRKWLVGSRRWHW